MITQLLKKMASPIRRFLGVDLVLSKQNQLIRELKIQRYQLDRAASYIEFASIDEARMRGSQKYKNFNNIISLLTPMDVAEAEYRRVGQDYDGGYVMLDDILSHKVDAAYSFGISNDVSWDEDIANLGIEVYMYDHTIDKLPKQNSRFHFFKKGVTGDPEEVGLSTLTNLLIRNDHQDSKNLILKMDIEGYEWSVFNETSNDVIGQFSQIVIELHGLNPNKTKEELFEIIEALKKINETHQSIHVHANGECPVSWLGEMALPHLLEVTYIRRSDYADRLVENTRTFPTEIDQPTFPWLPDVDLGMFTAKTDEKLPIR